MTNWVDTNCQYYGTYWGRENLPTTRTIRTSGLFSRLSRPPAGPRRWRATRLRIVHGRVFTSGLSANCEYTVSAPPGEGDSPEAAQCDPWRRCPCAGKLVRPNSLTSHADSLSNCQPRNSCFLVS